MDLPPSGWYPDPYGTPNLLRWWDGAGWTQHTHPDVTAGGTPGGEDPATTAVQGAAVESTAVAGTAVQDAIQATAVQSAVSPNTVLPNTVSPNTMSPNTMLPNAGSATAVLPDAALPNTALPNSGLSSTGLSSTGGQPSAQWLARTKPPTGPPTQPQPALPVSPGVAVAGYQATVQAGPVADGYQPTPVQPTTVQPTTVQPTTVQPGYPQPGMAWGGGNGAGTQVLPTSDGPWQPPTGPGGFAGPTMGNPYGYLQAQQQRRRRMLIGGVVGTVVAVTAIAIIVSSIGGPSPTPLANQSPTAAPPTPTAAPSQTAPSATTSPSASASPAATLSSSLVTDSQSGLSYSQLPAPWQGAASCPNTLNNGAFPWTDGEYAVAGQVNGNGGPVTWYGEACSGPLPQQAGYGGTQDLQRVANQLASTFENAYYNGLDHTITPGQDTPIQVSGHAAWEVSYDVSYNNASAQGATWTDEQAAVVLVDTGTATPAVFFTSIPASLNESYIPSLVSSLQLTTPPGTGGQPSAGQPSAGAAAAPNGGGNGNNP